MLGAMVWALRTAFVDPCLHLYPFNASFVTFSINPVAPAVAAA